MESYKKALLDFERVLIPQTKKWNSSSARDNWIGFTESATTLQDLSLATNIFSSCLVNPRGLEKICIDSTSIDTLASNLAALELQVPWSEVTDEFSDICNDWRNSLNTIICGHYEYERPMPDNYLGIIKESTLRLEEFMVEDGMIWSQESRNIWVKCVKAAESLQELAPLLLEFRRQINTSYACETTQTIIYDMSDYGLASFLLSTECAISWSGVIRQFRVKRAEWREYLHSIPDESDEDNSNDVVKEDKVNLIESNSCKQIVLNLDGDNEKTITINLPTSPIEQPNNKERFSLETALKLFFILLVLLILKV